MIAVATGGVRVVCIYAPNGRSVGSPFYAAKLAWFDRLARWLAEAANPDEPLVIGGDFNVAPEDADVWDPRACHGGTHVSPPEREAFEKLRRWGLVDRLSRAPSRAGPLHLVGLSRRKLPQELRHAHRSLAGYDRNRRAHRLGGDRSRGAQGQAASLRSRSARESTSTRRAEPSTRVGPRPTAESPRGSESADGQNGRKGRFSDRAADRADAREARDRAARGRRLALRAQVGRLSRDRLSRRRPLLHPEPRLRSRSTATSRSSRRRSARASARPLRRRRRDRDRDRARPRLRRAAAAPPSRRFAGREARRGDARRRSSRSTCSPTATTTCARCRRPSGARGSSSALAQTRRAACTSRPAAAIAALAGEWFHRFEGAGLDGVIAKHERTTYQPGKRAMVKVKHVRTADCVVAGFRWHKHGPGNARRLAAPRPLRRRGRAAPRRRDVVVHDGGAAPARRRARAAPEGRARGASVARVGERRPTARSACRARRAAGAPARISRGSRSASSASAR